MLLFLKVPRLNNKYSTGCISTTNQVTFVVRKMKQRVKVLS